MGEDLVFNQLRSFLLSGILNKGVVYLKVYLSSR